jgi:hypothetical protein
MFRKAALLPALFGPTMTRTSLPEKVMAVSSLNLAEVIRAYGFISTPLLPYAPPRTLLTAAVTLGFMDLFGFMNYHVPLVA